jgi:hypothetical protein
MNIVRRVLPVVLLITVAVASPAAARDWGAEEDAQLSLCTDPTKVVRLTQIWEDGQPTEKLNLYLETGASFCAFFSFKADAQVTSISQSGLSSPWQNSRSTAFRHVYTPYYGGWDAKADHYAKLLASGAERHWGTTQDHVDMQTPQEDPPDDDEEEDCTADASCPDDPGCGPFDCSPIVIDMAHDGYSLTSVNEGVPFDIDGNGLLERVAWTQSGSDDAWLAMDRNGNGLIDNGTELFGNQTRVFADYDDPTTTTNGFEALKFLESPPYGTSQADNVISANDAAFARLLLWTDINHNGLSEPYELRAVSSSSLRAISTDYRESRKKDRHSNEFRQRAKGYWDEGEFFIYDVWLTLAR